MLQTIIQIYQRWQVKNHGRSWIKNSEVRILENLFESVQISI